MAELVGLLLKGLPCLPTESKNETLLVVSSRDSTVISLDIAQYGYAISQTLYGPKMSGGKIYDQSKGRSFRYLEAQVRKLPALVLAHRNSH
jgi:hypothetical protein